MARATRASRATGAQGQGNPPGGGRPGVRAALPVPTKSRARLFATDNTQHVIDIARDPLDPWPPLLRFGVRHFVMDVPIETDTVGAERIHTRAYREVAPVDMSLTLIER